MHVSGACVSLNGQYSMYTLAIDIGNARIKAGHFRQEQLIKVDTFTAYDALERTVSGADRPDAIMLAAVAPVPERTKQCLGRVGELWELNPGLPLPIGYAYDTPETLGHDRLAAAAASWAIFPQQPSLVVDCGSCITYDYVSPQGVFEGGSISPGLQMRLTAMGTLTAALPTVELHEQEAVPLTGKSTRGALLSGAFYGVLREIEGFVQAYQQRQPDLRTVLSGGSAAFFESNLKTAIFVEPHLVLKGLNQILLFNA